MSTLSWSLPLVAVSLLALSWLQNRRQNQAEEKRQEQLEQQRKAEEAQQQRQKEVQRQNYLRLLAQRERLQQQEQHRQQQEPDFSAQRKQDEAQQHEQQRLNRIRAEEEEERFHQRHREWQQERSQRVHEEQKRNQATKSSSSANWHWIHPDDSMDTDPNDWTCGQSVDEDGILVFYWLNYITREACKAMPLVMQQQESEEEDSDEEQANIRTSSVSSSKIWIHVPASASCKAHWKNTQTGELRWRHPTDTSTHKPAAPNQKERQKSRNDAGAAGASSSASSSSASSSRPLRKLEPPVDTPGRWVLTANFRGSKSFGYFECESCHRFWTSAHAYPDKWQMCKPCNQKTYPQQMWVNTGRLRDRSEQQEEGKPHDQQRCQMCRELERPCWYIASHRAVNKEREERERNDERLKGK